jgi:hypothetical protein
VARRAAILALLLAATVSASGRPAAPLEFVLTYDGAITDGYTGRVYVMLSTSAQGEPRRGPAWNNPAPFFALDVEDWKPDTPLVFGDGALGHPGPPGTIEKNTYGIQAVMRRSPDSPSIGEGEGTAYSAVVTRELDGPTCGQVVLRIDRVVEPLPFVETEGVRLIETRSALLSAFYGRDVMMRAAAILPPGYDDADSGGGSRAGPGRTGSCSWCPIRCAARATTRLPTRTTTGPAARRWSRSSSPPSSGNCGSCPPPPRDS